MLIGVVLLAFCCAGLLALGLWLHRSLRQQVRLQAERDALQVRRIEALGKRLDAYLASTVRIGEEVEELRHILAPLPDKVNQLEQRDPGSLSFTQAARLIGLGASADDLTQSCGLSQAEAELMSRLHRRPSEP